MAAFPSEIIEKLEAPLDVTRVKHREGGGGRSLSYLESHDVIRTANTIFGVGGWGYRVHELTHIGTETFQGRNGSEGTRTGYRAVVQVWIGAGGQSYADVGFGDATDYSGSKITTHELASKEAVSDAVKRALRNLGDQFGLCLYDKFAPEHNGSPGGAGAAAGATPNPSAAAPRFPSPAPTAGGMNPTSAPSEKQVAFLQKLMVQHKVADLGIPWAQITKADASRFIEELKNGTFVAKTPAERELEELGAIADDPDENIPFDRTIDGLGN